MDTNGQAHLGRYDPDTAVKLGKRRTGPETWALMQSHPYLVLTAEKSNATDLIHFGDLTKTYDHDAYLPVAMWDKTRATCLLDTTLRQQILNAAPLSGPSWLLTQLPEGSVYLELEEHREWQGRMHLIHGAFFSCTKVYGSAALACISVVTDTGLLDRQFMCFRDDELYTPDFQRSIGYMLHGLSSEKATAGELCPPVVDELISYVASLCTAEH